MFLNPLLLIGVGAAVIPLVLHLLSRARYADVTWGAMMFLQGADLRQRHSSRLTQWLLLLVRGAAVGLLAVALARPVLRSTWAGAVPEGQLAAAIVLDCSASMSFDESGHTRLDAARAAARQVLEGLQPGDLACLVIAGGGDRGEAEVRPTPDLRAVADRVSAARAGYARADLAGALERAADQLRQTAAPTRHVYVVSDRQASSWHGVNAAFMAAWRESNRGGGPVRLFAVPVGAAGAQNVTVEAVTLLTAPAIRGQPTEVEVRVRNHGPVSWAALPVEVRAGGKRLPEVPVNLAAESVATVRATVSFDRVGSNLLSARVKAPGPAFDDRLDVAVEVVEPPKVLVLSGDERDAGGSVRNESHFLAVALAPFKANAQPGPDPSVVTVAPADQWARVRLRDYQVVVLANVERFTEAQAQAVEQFVYEGGGLLVAPGGLSRAAEYNALLHRGGAGVLPAELREPTPADGSAATTLLGLRMTHPAFQFLRGRPDPLPPATIGRYFPARAAGGAESELAEYGSGDPFLIEGKAGRGRVLLVTTPLDADWSTLPLTNFYLPFVQSAVRYLAAGAVQDRNLESGEVLEAAVEPPLEGKTATLYLPDGTKAELPILRYGVGGRGEVRYADTDRPGTYRLVIRGGGAGGGGNEADRSEKVVHFVVPTPRDEADLTQLTDARWREMEQGLGLRTLDPDPLERSIASALTGPRGGRELWGPALSAVLVMCVAEMFLARSVARQSE